VRIGVAADAASSLAGADLGARIVVAGVTIPPDAGDRAVIVLRARGDVTLTAPPEGVWGVLADMRESLTASAAGLPGPGAALVPGLAVGDTSAVDAALDEAMTTSSLSHLTAVSGANCAIVVGLAFWLAAACGATRAFRVAIALGALVGFVLLVTPEPSVVRAGAMAAIAMLAVALGRTGAGLAVLASAVTVLLVVDPWLSLSLGFALSTAATASLLVLARPLAAGLERWMPRALALALAVPLAAQLACAPLLILIDPRVPLLGVVANLLAAPAAPPATVTGFFACLAAGVPVLQDGLVAVAWVPASWIAGVAGAVAAIPAQQLPWMEGAPGAAALAIVCACVTVVIALRPGRGGRPRRVLRFAALCTVAVLVGIGGARTALSYAPGAATVPSAWSIAMCDVGQGDAVLIRSAGAVALVDTGPDPAPLAACLERFAVSRLDLVVLTHFDQDHVGGVAAVSGRARTVLHGPVDDAAGERVLRLLRAGGADTVDVDAGRTGRLGAAQWRVLWPAASVTEAGNDASVVLEVEGGGVPHVLLLGDLSEEPQQRIAAALPDGGVEVVKVAHHGSADQAPAIYDRADASLGLIPVGADNDYGHPRESLLDVLRAEGTAVARSDLDGTVAVWRDERGLRLWRERGVGGAG
jgi:competence protein ComEC